MEQSTALQHPRRDPQPWNESDEMLWHLPRTAAACDRTPLFITGLTEVTGKNYNGVLEQQWRHRLVVGADGVSTYTIGTGAKATERRLARGEERVLAWPRSEKRDETAYRMQQQLAESPIGPVILKWSGPPGTEGTLQGAWYFAPYRGAPIDTNTLDALDDVTVEAPAVSAAPTPKALPAAPAATPDGFEDFPGALEGEDDDLPF